MRGRRGISELVGTLIAVIIISSLLASIVLVGGEFKGNVRNTVFRASERLIEAANPPKLVLTTVNNSLILKIISVIPVDVRYVFISFSNGSVILVNVTEDIYDNGQIILRGYMCERVRVGVITSLGNVFYYDRPYYDCESGGDPGNYAASNSVVPYVFQGYLYSQTNSTINVINNVNIDFSFTFNLRVTNNVCTGELSYSGQSTSISSVSIGGEGYRWGSAVGPINLVQGIDLYLAPALYRTSSLCIAGIEFRYTKPTIIRSSISLDAVISSDTVFIDDIREGNIVLTPIIYTQQSESYIDSSYMAGVDDTQLNGQANGFAIRTMISDILILAVASIHQSQVYISEIQETVTISISRIIYSEAVWNNITKELSGPYLIRVLTPTPQGLGSGLENALVEAVWVASQSSALKVVIDGRELRLGSRPILSTSYSRVVITSIQAPELMLNSKISYNILYYDNSTLSLQVTVGYGSGARLLTPPTMVLIEQANGSLVLVLPYGYRQPISTGGLSYSTASTLDPGGRLLIAGILELTNNLGLDLSYLVKTRAPIQITPGFYIVNEIYTQAGVKMVSAMVILAP